MGEVHTVPGGLARHEIRVVNSRFIASAGPAFSVEEARAFIQQIRGEFPDASHHVPAFLVGHGASVMAHCTDDGEPAGSAGRPVLTVLQGSELGDVVLVVTRYFGGTKLGIGGLVRAYTQAAQEVLSVLPLAQKRATHTARLVVPYTFYDRIRLLIGQCGGEIQAEDFQAEVSLTLMFPVENLEAFQEKVQEITRGTAQAVVLETKENTLFPIKGSP